MSAIQREMCGMSCTVMGSCQLAEGDTRLEVLQVFHTDIRMVTLMIFPQFLLPLFVRGYHPEYNCDSRLLLSFEQSPSSQLYIYVMRTNP